MGATQYITISSASKRKLEFGMLSARLCIWIINNNVFLCSLACPCPCYFLSAFSFRFLYTISTPQAKKTKKMEICLKKKGFTFLSSVTSMKYPSIHTQTSRQISQLYLYVKHIRLLSFRTS